MAELTREQLIEEAKLKIAIAECHPNSGMAQVECELFKIALASLEAEPVAYIFKHPAGKLFWSLTDESNKGQSDVMPVYAAAPASVVPDNASGSLAYAYKELTPEIMRGHIAVFERYGIAPNDSSTTIQALRIALDGIERSDSMLYGRQPCHQITAAMAKAIALKLGAELNNEEAEIFADGYNAAVLHGVEPVSQTYKLNEMSGNSPVTPGGWISCSERMPEKHQNVLISVNFDSSLVEPLICSARYTGSTFRRGDATVKPGNDIEQATHWMPLPEPPQEVN
ncbi:DUF551 domain-containing protein [Escherichia coli]|nr:DUF551 domain-containing protein [Escherichia coli]